MLLAIKESEFIFNKGFMMIQETNFGQKIKEIAVDHPVFDFDKLSKQIDELKLENAALNKRLIRLEGCVGLA